MPVSRALPWSTFSFGLALVAVTGCVSPSRDRATTQPAPAIEVLEERWPDGQLHVRREVRRSRDGTPVNHGRYESWFPGGQKEYEATYAHGQLEGAEYQWHDNGQLRTEQHYARGRRHGPRFDWDPDGRLRKEENYADDLPDGLWTIWDKDGRIKWQQRFERGQPVR